MRARMARRRVLLVGGEGLAPVVREYFHQLGDYDVESVEYCDEAMTTLPLRPFDLVLQRRLGRMLFFAPNRIPLCLLRSKRASVWLLMRPGVTHSLIGTFRTYQECRERGATSEDRGVAFCLPDTVDPRGPKGK